MGTKQPISVLEQVFSAARGFVFPDFRVRVTAVSERDRHCKVGREHPLRIELQQVPPIDSADGIVRERIQNSSRSKVGTPRETRPVVPPLEIGLPGFLPCLRFHKLDQRRAEPWVRILQPARIVRRGDGDADRVDSVVWLEHDHKLSVQRRRSSVHPVQERPRVPPVVCRRAQLKDAPAPFPAVECWLVCDDDVGHIEPRTRVNINKEERCR